MSRLRSPRVRLVEPGRWFWLEDYALLSASYYLSCPPNRRVEYGSGLFTNNQPMGSREKFSGSTRVSVLGAGSIHVRVADDLGPCHVGIWQEKFALADVYSNPSLLDAAVDAANKIAKALNKD